jgi:hypothetical protein
MSKVISVGLNPLTVTASDSTTYSPILEAIYIGTGGTLIIKNNDGVSVTYTNLPNASWLDVRATKVMTTGTTASGIIGHR